MKRCSPAGGCPCDERGEPVGDRGEEDGDRPEEQEDEVRNREDEPEEDRQTVPPQVVLDDELDWMFWMHVALMTYAADVHSR